VKWSDGNTADAASASGTQKVMIDGQNYILRDGKAYTVTGAEVK